MRLAIASFTILGTALTASAQTVYTNDFQSPVGPEWSVNTTSTTPVGGRVFLGEFGGTAQSTTLTLSGLPTHTDMQIDFDLFVIRTADGNTGDRVQVIVDSVTEFDSSFANNSISQSYPGQWFSNNAARTGAAEIDTLGYIDDNNLPRDTVYNISMSFQHSGPTASIEFYGLFDESIANESWGIDNITVSVVPEPTVLSGIAAAPLLLRRRRR